MEIVKKNLLSIICGVIALVAIATIPTFIRTQQKALQKTLEAHGAVYKTLDGLNKKARHQPVVSIDPNAPVPDLPGFPGPKVIESGKAAISAVQAQSLELEKMAVEMNKHELLVPNSLPVVSDTFTFQRKYQDEMQTGIPKLLNSVTPPTEAEINAQKTALQEKLLADAPRNQVTGDVLFKPALDQDIARRTAALPDQLRYDAAHLHKMYMAPGSALSNDPNVSGGASGMAVALDAEKIWLAQLGLWVQQDVAQAIADANKDSKEVATSPVKELALIDIEPNRGMYALPGGVSAAPSPMGAPPASPVKANLATEALPTDFTVSPTGRVCNGVFDVVHFTVCMDVQASKVNQIIQALERGRLLTVFHSDILAVNGAAKQQEGYFYGPVPVITLTVKCEELFMRSWTRPLMPPSIKQFLNVQEPAAQPTAMAN